MSIHFENDFNKVTRTSQGFALGTDLLTVVLKRVRRGWAGRIGTLSTLRTTVPKRNMFLVQIKIYDDDSKKELWDNFIFGSTGTLAQLPLPRPHRRAVPSEEGEDRVPYLPLSLVTFMPARSPKF